LGGISIIGFVRRGDNTMNDNNSVDKMRVKYGFWIVLVGIVIVGAVFIVAILKWTTAADVATAVGSIAGVIGTIIGAFFGVQVGSSGKEKAEADRNTAQNMARDLAAALDPNVAKSVLEKY
jgi:hypothetical protein